MRTNLRERKKLWQRGKFFGRNECEQKTKKIKLEQKLLEEKNWRTEVLEKNGERMLYIHLFQIICSLTFLT